MVHTNNIQLYIGSSDELLNWKFSLAQDPVSVALQLGGSSVDIIAPYTPSVTVTPAFTPRFNVSWVTGHVTLMIYNVTTSDEGVFSCQVSDATSGNIWKRNIKVTVVGNYSVIVL